MLSRVSIPYSNKNNGLILQLFIDLFFNQFIFFFLFFNTVITIKNSKDQLDVCFVIIFSFHLDSKIAQKFAMIIFIRLHYSLYFFSSSQVTLIKHTRHDDKIRRVFLNPQKKRSSFPQRFSAFHLRRILSQKCRLFIRTIPC